MEQFNDYTLFQQQQSNDGISQNSSQFSNLKNNYESMKINIVDQQEKEQIDEITIKKKYRLQYLSLEQNAQSQNANTYEIAPSIKNHELYTYFQNRNTIVKLKYNADQNQFIIEKKNLCIEENFFDMECLALELQKNKQTTFDIISKNPINKSFQQIAGKLDLFLLKERIEDKHVFEVYFWILLDKLNRLHELGIAHSDIKPQNIVISFDNEPFFIDFDSSCNLNDYDSYLQSFTFNYNLDVYIHREYVNNKYELKRIKEFKTEEEVKLCDKVQLALTFLFLFCQCEEQDILFLRKDFNELIKSLEKSHTLSIISIVLNQADPKIEILKDEQEQEIIIDHFRFYEQIKISNDITFNEQSNFFEVNYINKFSIRLFHLLDNLKFNISISPEDTRIIPQPEMSEYQQIIQKYKQIDQYLNSLITYDSNQKNKEFYLNNLCDYLSILQNKKCYIDLKDICQIQYILQKTKNSQYLDTLELNFKFQQFGFHLFIQSLDIKQFNYFIQSFTEEDEYFFTCKICKDTYQNEKININFNFSEKKSNQKAILDFIEQNCKNKSLQIIIKLRLYKLDNLSNNIKEYLSMIKQLNQETCYLFTMDFEYEYDLRQLFIYKLVSMNFDVIEKYLQVNKMDDIDYSSEEIYNLLTYDKLTLLKVLNFQGEEIISQFLQIAQDIDKKIFKLIFKFYNIVFLETKIWQEFQQYLGKKNNGLIEVIFENCQFSQNIADILKSLQNTYSPVKYQFNEFEIQNELNQQKSMEDDNNFRIEIKLQFIKEDPTQQGLNILFIQKLTTLNKNENQIIIDDFQQLKYDQNSIQNSQPQLDNKITQSQDEQKKELLNFDGIKKLISIGQQTYKSKPTSEIKITDQFQIYDTKIKFNHKKIAKILTKEDLDFVIEEINQKINYSNISIQILNNDFNYCQNKDCFELQHQFLVRCVENCNEINLNNQFKILINSLFNSQFHQNNLFIINQEYIYQSFMIKENIQYNENEFSLKMKDEHQSIDLKYSNRLQLQCIFFLESFQDENILEDFLKIQIVNKLQEYQKQYSLRNINIFYQIPIMKNYFIEIKFQINQYLGDKCFQILFLGIQEIFNEKEKSFEAKNCGITIQTLYNLYESLKNQKNQILKFNFEENDISYQQFRKFFKEILEDQSIHNYNFYIEQYDDYVEEQLTNEFYNYIKIQDMQYFQYLMKRNNCIPIEYKPQQQEHDSCLINIYIDLKQFENELNTKEIEINSLTEDKSKRFQILKKQAHQILSMNSRIQDQILNDFNFNKNTQNQSDDISYEEIYVQDEISDIEIFAQDTIQYDENQKIREKQYNKIQLYNPLIYNQFENDSNFDEKSQNKSDDTSQDEINISDEINVSDKINVTDEIQYDYIQKNKNFKMSMLVYSGYEILVEKIKKYIFRTDFKLLRFKDIQKYLQSKF